MREALLALDKLQPYRTTRALWLAAASAFILSLVMMLGAINPTTHRVEDAFNIAYISVFNLLLFIALYTYNFWIIRVGMKRGQLVAAGLLGSLVVSTSIATLQWLIEGALFGETFNTLIITIIINASSALIAYLVTLLLYNVTVHQQTVVENEHLQAENMRIRYRTLEQQVSPHFLFNSLNTLDGLIGVDNNSAHRYLHALSDSFRYTLSRQETVTLAEELEFTRGYIDMMQMRYGSEALKVEIDISDDLLERRLPSISLQLLVENAVKHNVATQRAPLTISIASTADMAVRVSNTRQPKEGHEESSGIGLSNLNGRYNALFHRDIEIVDNDRVFYVEIPLI